MVAIEPAELATLELGQGSQSGTISCASRTEGVFCRALFSLPTPEGCEAEASGNVQGRDPSNLFLVGLNRRTGASPFRHHGAVAKKAGAKAGTRQSSPSVTPVLRIDVGTRSRSSIPKFSYLASGRSTKWKDAFDPWFRHDISAVRGNQGARFRGARGSLSRSRHEAGERSPLPGCDERSLRNLGY